MAFRSANWSATAVLLGGIALIAGATPALADDLRSALLKLSPDGRFTEVAELVAVVARRPADQANSTFTIS